MSEPLEVDLAEAEARALAALCRRRGLTESEVAGAAVLLLLEVVRSGEKGRWPRLVGRDGNGVELVVV